MIRLIIALFLCISVSQADEREAWQRPGYIADSFIEIALNSEYGVHTPRLRRWEAPVRVYLSHEVGNRALHEELVDAHLSQLAQITGLSIRRVDRAENANLMMFLLPESALLGRWREQSGQDSLPPNALCLGRLQTDRRGVIRRGWVFIPVDRARHHGQLISCIVEELTQVLGLPNDSDRVFPSIFNDRSVAQLLTGLDLVLLKLLYHEKLEAGMSPDQVRPLLNGLIEELSRAGIIARAQEQVSQGALYRLLGFGQ
ncbi:MAG: hypothetical protein CMI01_04170 [Oceanospirillaceae bacterium]|nr:hypothetical protein [Oceanospirillaceae bacterium]